MERWASLGSGVALTRAARARIGMMVSVEERIIIGQERLGGLGGELQRYLDAKWVCGLWSVL